MRGKEAIGGWRHVRIAVRDPKEGNPGRFFLPVTNQLISEAEFPLAHWTGVMSLITSVRLNMYYNIMIYMVIY